MKISKHLEAHAKDTFANSLYNEPRNLDNFLRGFKVVSWRKRIRHEKETR